MFVANSNCAICSICSFSCYFVTLNFIFRLYHFQFFCSNIEMTWNCLAFRCFLVSSLFLRLVVSFSKFLRVSRFNEYEFCDLFHIILCNSDAVFSSNTFKNSNFSNRVIALTQSIKIEIFKAIFIEYTFFAPKSIVFSIADNFVSMTSIYLSKFQFFDFVSALKNCTIV